MSRSTRRKETFQMYLCVGVNGYNEGKFALTQYDPEALQLKHRDTALVKKVEVTIEVPGKVDIVGLKVKALEEALQMDKADSQVRHNLLADQISKLKCLTHDSGICA